MSVALRLVFVLLLLLQPLAPRGLAELLPCPEACGHCAGESAADPAPSAGCGCEAAATAEPLAGGEDDCRCVHAPEPAQPAEAAKSLRCALDECVPPPSARRGMLHEDRAPARERGVTPDGRPPPAPARLCVWRE
jgi:hypothetical protein